MITAIVMTIAIADDGSDSVKDGKIVHLETAILAKNNALAMTNRRWFEKNGVLALNLVSSPGSGKTTLLEHTIQNFARWQSHCRD